MNAYWLNQENGKYISVVKHDISLAKEKERKELGLDENSNKILDMISKGIKDSKQKEDVVRIAGMMLGLIRIRVNDNRSGRQSSIQFYFSDNFIENPDKNFDLAEKFLENNGISKPIGNKPREAVNSIYNFVTRVQPNSFKFSSFYIENIGKEGDNSISITSDEMKDKNIVAKISDAVSFMSSERQPVSMFRNETDTNKLVPSNELSESLERLSVSMKERASNEEKMKNKRMVEDINRLFESHKKIINEEELSRVWKMNRENIWAIITAYRGDNDEKTNKELNKKLMNDIRSQGYGYWEVDGRWVEVTDEGEKQDVGERSLFVSAEKDSDPEKFLSFIKKMTEKYETMLYQYKTYKNGERVIDRQEFPIGKFIPQQKGDDGYTKIIKSGRTFVFR
jgi:hypothetical protein